MVIPRAARRFQTSIPIIIAAVICTGGLSPISSTARGADNKGAIAGYADFAEFSRQVEALAKPGLCDVSSLGTTLGGRKIYLLTIGGGKAAEKPAILVVGNVHAPQLLGSELAVRIARELLKRGANDPAVKDLLARHTFYIIPRPSPDASEAFFQRPLREREGNLRKTRDERDADPEGDKAEDLNHDGLITMMRVADETGRYRVSPDDSRAMVPADPQKGERGQYDLYVEGRHDDSAAEHPGRGDGVAFNRNFPFKYPFFKPGAGPNAVSEIETRAVADFAFDHPNIAVVYTFSPEDNLLHPWKPGGDQGRIKSSLQAGDAAEFDYVAQKYRTIAGAADSPASPAGEGSFSDWAYFQYGRWSFAARGWWIPRVGGGGEKNTEKADAEKPSDARPADARPTDAAPPPDDRPAGRGPRRGGRRPFGQFGPPAAESKPAEDTYGVDPVNALRWFDREKIDGFVPWTRIEHPDFPGRKVEVGGFKPFLLLNPPAKLLDPLAEKQTDFVVELARLMPRVKIQESRVEPLGGGIQRITVTVANTGYLPTMSEMGRTTGEVYPLLLRLSPPKGTEYVKGVPRTELGRIRGGEKTEWTWLIRTPDGKPGKATVTVSSPVAGSDTTTLELK